MIKKYIPYIVILILLFSWFQSCENQKSEINDLKTEISIDSLNFKTEKDDLGRKISFQDKKIVSDRKTMKRLTSKVEGLRKINMQIKASVKTSITNVESVPVGDLKIIRDTVLIDSSNKINHFLKLPQSFKYKSEWMKFKYSIDTLGKSLIDTAEFLTKPVITFGYKDQGFLKNVFKKPVPVISYQDKNPFSEVKGLKNIEFDPKKKWYQRKIVWFASGIAAGILILK